MNNPIKKILMIGTIDTKGGAAKVSYALGEAFETRGYQVDYFVGWKYSNNPRVHEIPKNPFYYRLSRLFATDLTFSRSDYILKRPEYVASDIVHFHNIHSGFFNLSTFKKITSQKPSIWTLHDIWPVTPYQTTEKSMREEKPWKLFGFLWDRSKSLLMQKQKVFIDSKVSLVVPSKWMDTQIRESPLSSLPREIIHNPIDTSIFFPRDKQKSREHLKLPSEKKIILFVAPKGLKDSLKGSGDILHVAKAYASHPEYLFVGIGGKEVGQKENILSVGYIDNQETLGEYYSAADVFLYPSQADSFGLVVAEAMACGTPGVVFKTDALPELVSHTEDGFVTEKNTVEDLQKGLSFILSQSTEAYETMSRACAAKITQNYSLSRIVDQYIALYDRICNQ